MDDKATIGVRGLGVPIHDISDSRGLVASVFQMEINATCFAFQL
jgi:hypothetical protein